MSVTKPEFLKDYLDKITDASLEHLRHANKPTNSGIIFKISIVSIFLILGGLIYWFSLSRPNSVIETVEPKIEFLGKSMANAETYTPQQALYLERKEEIVSTNGIEPKNILPRKNKEKTKEKSRALSLQQPITNVIVKQQQDQTKTMEKMLTYVVQVGIFRSYESAEKVKAELALLGYTSKINQTKSTVDPNQLLYGVIVGPPQNKSAAEQLKKRLENQHVSNVSLISKLS